MGAVLWLIKRVYFILTHPVNNLLSCKIRHAWQGAKIDPRGLIYRKSNCPNRAGIDGRLNGNWCATGLYVKP